MNTSTRYRSHHDSRAALERALGIERHRRSDNTPSFPELLATDPPARPRGLYLHVPFCDNICSFCNMNRKYAQRDAVHAYVDELKRQLSELRATPYVRGVGFDAIYFGGGTPTAFRNEELEVVIATLVESVPIAPDCEWTVESTLHNLTPTKLSLLADAGVNRLSIGVQTFSDSGRETLGRVGDGRWAAEQLESVRRSFDGTIGIDLIYSYPGQTIKEVQTDAEWVHRLDIDSVSIYSLMIHDGSRLSEQIANAEIEFERSIESDRARHNALLEGLYGAGFELLELTKVARPNRDEYRYIRIRYDNGDLVPVGNGAGGRVSGHRVYRMAPGRIMISPTDDRHDELNRVLGFLQFGRYEIEPLVRLCGEPAREVIATSLGDFAASGWLRLIRRGVYELSPDGVFWGNNLAVSLLQSIVASLAPTTNTVDPPKRVPHES